MRHTIADLSVGTRVYYTGDCANPDGWGRIKKHHEPDRFAGPTVTVAMDDGRSWGRISPAAFDESPGRRFWPGAEWEADRAARIAQMHEDYKAFLAKT